MKTKILISIICACSLFKVQAQEWEYVCSLTGEQLCKVCTQGTDTVYVVGENGLIAKSADKGLTWDKQYFHGKETLNDIIFCNHEVGFIVGNNGTILRTRDAGSSWEQMFAGTVLNINAIAAFDLDNIWAIGNVWDRDIQEMKYRNLIIHSTDMGETWITKPLLPDNLYLPDIKCKGNRGYITGNGGIILKTEDEGTTWEEQILTGYYGISSLSITDNKVYALGGDKIIFSENNINWHILDAAVSDSKKTIYFQDDQKGFLASYAITTCWICDVIFWIYKTTDGGNTWEEVYSEYLRGKDSDQSNFTFSSTNEFGYYVLGNHLVRTPYTGEFDSEYCSNYYVDINVIKSENPTLVLNQRGNELQINSNSKTIAGVEIISVTGIKLFIENIQANEINVNVNKLPQGVYLTRILFTDKTNETVKWIKH